MSETLTLEITDLSRGGAGVARDAGGRVVFVPFTAPGDQVRVRIVEEDKRYAQAELIEVIRPSGIRQVPRCPAFTRCGGCQWQHLPYEFQWKTKLSGVRHALTRVGVAVGMLEELPADQIWEYRNRIQLRGENRPDGTILGFYAARSHQVVTLDRCDIARSEINQAWEEIRGESSRYQRPFKIEVEVAENGELLKSWNRGHAAHGFRQVHDGQNEKLRAWVKVALTQLSTKRSGAPFGVLDLFGGSGNLSFQLISDFSEIHCVDFSVPREKPEGFPAHFHFHRASVADWVRKFRPENRSWAVILDPPRQGLDRDFRPIVEKLEQLNVQGLVAVGCDPDAWARDVSRFLKRGWKLERAAVLDLFPQTPHVESLAYLTREV